MTKSHFSRSFYASALALTLVSGAVPFPVSVLAPGAALAQTADVSLTDIVLEFGLASYRIPRIDVRGSTLPEADLRALFAKDSPVSLKDRIAKFSAQQVTIPEIRMETGAAGARDKATYNDVTLSDIKEGRIATLVAKAGTFENDGKPGKASVGAFTATDFDLVQAFSVFADKAGDPLPEMRRIYSSISLESFMGTDGEGLEVSVGRVTARDFKARPTPQSWAETMRLMSLKEGDKASDDEKAKTLQVAGIDLLTSFSYGSMEMVDFQSADRSGPKPIVVRVARVAYTGEQPGRLGDMRLDGLDLTVPEGTGRIASIAVSDFSAKNTLEGLKQSGGSTAPMNPQDARKLVPTVGSIRMAGLDFDLSGGASPVRFALRSFEMTSDKPINGIPTAFKMSFDKFTMPVEALQMQDGLNALADLGYKVFDLSATLSAAWNETTNELSLREVSVGGGGMGRVVLRAALGNVTRDLFDADTAISSVALVGATLKSLDIAVENTGLAEKVIAQQAAEQKRSPEDLRREVGMTAAVGIPAILGNSPQAKALGSAVARFIARPKTLTIAARARDGVGLGAADLALIGDPNALMGKIDVTAKAE